MWTEGIEANRILKLKLTVGEKIGEKIGEKPDLLDSGEWAGDEIIPA